MKTTFHQITVLLILALTTQIGEVGPKSNLTVVFANSNGGLRLVGVGVSCLKLVSCS
jgi:hypothetical protein